MCENVHYDVNAPSRKRPNGPFEYDPQQQKKNDKNNQTVSETVQSKNDIRNYFVLRRLYSKIGPLRHTQKDHREKDSERQNVWRNPKSESLQKTPLIFSTGCYSAP
jgi:hypothetical protein